RPPRRRSRETSRERLAARPLADQGRFVAVQGYGTMRPRMLTLLEFLRHENPVWDLPARYAEALARDFPEVRVASPATRAEAAALLPESDIVFGWAVREANFAEARRLRWIHVAAASVAPLMFPALIQSEVVVTNGRGTHAEAMAEHTIGVLLAFARKLHLARDAQNRRQWLAEVLW